MTSHDPGDDRGFRDDDLRARFAVLRQEEEALAPEFALPSGVAQGRRPSGRRIALAVSLATVVAVVVLVARFVPQKGHPDPGTPVASLTEWKAPTDFLLETPGRELLRTVPAIGVWHDYTEATKPNQKHTPVRKHFFP
jgi:hypothetical protein